MVDPATAGLLSKMNYWVYVIKNQSTGKIYIGQTKDLNRRLARHNKRLPTKNTSYTTKNTGPWVVVYKEKHKSYSEALTREKQLKSHQGKKLY